MASDTIAYDRSILVSGRFGRRNTLVCNGRIAEAYRASCGNTRSAEQSDRAPQMFRWALVHRVLRGALRQTLVACLPSYLAAR